MHLDPVACYRALLARDPRYDGRFFTCVKTTGIYCRPICPARSLKFENCIFVPSAAAAQEAGFRPCLRCRPESSPDLGAWRGTSATVSRALALIEAGALDGSNIEALAARLGMGGRLACARETWLADHRSFQSPRCAANDHRACPARVRARRRPRGDCRRAGPGPGAGTARRSAAWVARAGWVGRLRDRGPCGARA